MSIGKKIKQLREQRKLSQKELADSLGVTQQAIDAWERSITNPRKKSIDKLSSFFNVSGGFFFENDMQNKIPSPEIITNKEKNKPKDLIKLLEKEEYTLNGEIVTQEDRDKIKRVIEALYWDAKEKNKRKK